MTATTIAKTPTPLNKDPPAGLSGPYDPDGDSLRFVADLPLDY